MFEQLLLKFHDNPYLIQDNMFIYELDYPKWIMKFVMVVVVMTFPFGQAISLSNHSFFYYIMVWCQHMFSFLSFCWHARMIYICCLLSCSSVFSLFLSIDIYVMFSPVLLYSFIFWLFLLSSQVDVHVYIYLSHFGKYMITTSRNRSHNWCTGRISVNSSTQ